jgi:hypothetical protein
MSRNGKNEFVTSESSQCLDLVTLLSMGHDVEGMKPAVGARLITFRQEARDRKIQADLALCVTFAGKILHSLQFFRAVRHPGANPIQFITVKNVVTAALHSSLHLFDEAERQRFEEIHVAYLNRSRKARLPDRVLRLFPLTNIAEVLIESRAEAPPG